MNGRRSDVKEDAHFQRHQDGYSRVATYRYPWGISLAFIEDGQPISDVDHITVASGVHPF